MKQTEDTRVSNIHACKRVWHRHWLHLEERLLECIKLCCLFLTVVCGLYKQTSKLLNYFINKTHNWCDARVYLNYNKISKKKNWEKQLEKVRQENNKLNWTNDTLAKVTYGVIKTRTSIHHWNICMSVCLSVHCFAIVYV